MKEKIRILIVEDNKIDAELMEIALAEKFVTAEFKRVDNELELMSSLLDYNPGLVLSDYSMPGFSGIEALRISKAMKPDIPFIFVSGTIGEERAVEALKNGAADYVLKSSLVRLPHAVKMALDLTAEKLLKAKQQKKIQQLSLVASQIDNGVWIGNTELKTQWVNRAFIQQTGFSYEELMAMSIRELLAKVGSNEEGGARILNE